MGRTNGITLWAAQSKMPSKGPGSKAVITLNKAILKQVLGVQSDNNRNLTKSTKRKWAQNYA